MKNSKLYRVTVSICLYLQIERNERITLPCFVVTKFVGSRSKLDALSSFYLRDLNRSIYDYCVSHHFNYFDAHVKKIHVISVQLVN